MYHCHFEDVEHVQMGMTGMVFVRPKQNRSPVGGDPVGTKYAYNDGDGSTRYDREFAFMITELWSAAHYRDAHIQVSDWTDFDPSFWLLNGRGYPDTVAPNGNPIITAAGRLQYQPISSLVTCNAGERVLLRMSNLGYQNHAMTVDNIDLTDRGQGRQPAQGARRHGELPHHQQRRRRPRREPGRHLHGAEPRASTCSTTGSYSYLDNGGGPGYGGMMTKIVVGAAGHLRPPDRREHVTPAPRRPDELRMTRISAHGGSPSSALVAALVAAAVAVTSPHAARPRRPRACCATPTRTRRSR